MMPMKCPVCGKEYRAGTMRCRKCEVLLSESIADDENIDPGPESATAAASAKQNRRAPLLLWSGQDPVLFSAVTHALAESAIPFYESAVHDPAVGLFASFPLRSESAGLFEIRVAGCDVAAAREILDLIVGTIGNIGVGDPEEEISERADDAYEHDGASRGTGRWRADEATAELWNGADEAWAAYMIDVLWENKVQARRIRDPVAAISRVLVHPADFARAERVLRLLEQASAPD